MQRKINILVEIGHPAHVHFFKNPISMWKQNGHTVHIVTRDKEITHQLLNEIGLEYISLSKQKTNLFLMMLELLRRWIAIFYIIKKNRIDVAISISGISTSFPAYLGRIVAITDTDTEDAGISNTIAFHFSDVVLTPSTFLKKERYKKIKTYESFHELAYLHPNWYTPDPTSLRLFNINKDEKYVFIRLVKWKALHDIHEQGFSEESLRRLIVMLKDRGYTAFISSERMLAPDFDRYLIKGNLSRIFDLMALSEGFIGESPTMAVETAILGKPSVLINSRVNHLGNMIELQNKYGLLKNFVDFSSAESFIDQEFFSQGLRDKVSAAREKLLRDKIDISDWIAKFTVEYTSHYYEGRK